jgi:hypothetical protein
MITSISSSGRKARPPKWWGKLVDTVPRLELPWLRPKTWTPELAQKWMRSIPSKCPFERQWWVGDRLVLFIPALCSLNPLSTQLYSLRLEAQTYLARLEADKKSV